MGRRLRCERTVVPVPMKFPQTIRLKIYIGGSSPRLLEVPGRILDLNPTTRGDLLLLLGQAEYIRIGNVTVRRHFGLFVSAALLRGWNCTPEDVGVLGGNLLEIGDAEAEILSDDFNRGVDEPI